MKIVETALEKSHYTQELTGPLATIKTNQDLMNTNVRQLIPRITKRGALNFLGGIIKAISGNLDQEDAQRYDNAINILEKNQQQIVKIQREQISLSLKGIEDFKSNLDKLRNNQIIIKSRILQLGEVMKNQTIFTMELKHKVNLHFMLFQIANSMITINFLLDKLITGKTFAKLQTYHPTMLDSNILFTELKKIQEQYPNTKLPLTVNEENMYAIEKTLTIKAYRKLNTFNFLIEIPICEPVPYQFYKLFLIPKFTNNTSTFLKISNTYLAENNVRYMSMAKPCIEIKEQQYLCETNSKTIHDGTPCEYQLIRHSYQGDDACSYTARRAEKPSLSTIGKGEWILHTPEEEHITIRCGEREEERRIEGTHLIQTTADCEVTWNQEILRTHSRNIINREFQINPIQLSNLTEDTPHWKHEDIRLQEIQWEDYNRTKDQLADLFDNLQHYYHGTTIGVSTTITILTIIITVFIFIIYYRHKKAIQPKDVATPGEPDEGSRQHPWLRPST